MKSIPYFVIGLVATAIWLNVVPSQSLEQTESSRERAVPVQVTSLEAVAGYSSERLYTGLVRAGRTTQASFLGRGEITKILVEEGQRVRKGQLLALLDSRALEARRRLLNARLASVQARLRELQAGPRPERRRASAAREKGILRELELARQKESRRSELFAQGAIAREQLDDYSTRVRTLEMQLQDAREQTLELERGTRVEQLDAQRAQVQEVVAQLGQLEVEFQDTELRSPYAGILARRLLDEGAVVNTGTPVLELYEEDTLEAVIALPIDLKAPLQTPIKTGNTSVQAEFLGWLPQADSASATRPARYLVQGQDLTPGLTASLSLTRTIKEPGYWLPAEALVSAGKGLWDCYTVDDQSRLRRQQVEVLTSQGDRVLVRGTVREGQSVVIKDTESLVAGQLVSAGNKG